MTSSGVAQIELLLHFFDVCTNQVLYSRQVYPKMAFKLVSCYGNVPVYQVQDPEVRSFINEGLTGLKTMLLEEPHVKVTTFEVVLLDEKGTVLESYNFGMPIGDVTKQDPQKAKSTLRGILLQLASRMSDLPPLSEPTDDGDLSFTFRLETQNEQELQSLQWFEVTAPDSTVENPKPTSVMPVAKGDQNCLRMDVEIMLN